MFLALLLLSGCALFQTKEDAFKIYYNRCAEACRQGQSDIHLEVSTLDLVYQCRCGGE